MDDKVKEIEPRCKHLVLDECSQEHHNNCVGLRQCILDMEKQNLALKEENEKLQRIREIAMRIHKDWNEFDPINEGYIERIENKNKELEQKLKLAVEALENTQDTLVVAFAGNVSDCDYLDRIDGQWAINNEALTKIGQVE